VPQFIEPLDTDEYEKETIELLSQVSSLQHDYLNIFREKGGTETPAAAETFTICVSTYYNRQS